MLLRLTTITASVLLLSQASSAAAQGWLQDRNRTEGPGIRLGDLELHPGIGIELGYDSNVFYSSDDRVQGSGIMRVTPHLNVSTLGIERRGDGETRGTPPVVAFSGGLSASYYLFFIDEARNNVSVDADLRLTINPERPVSFTIYETFGRSVRPFTETAGEGDIDYARIRNTAGARFDLGTVGGVLRGHVGYELNLEIFESDDFAYANNLFHRIQAGTSWKFLPNTALIYDFQFDIQDFINTDDPSLVLRSDAYRVRSRVGVNGSITNTLSASVLVGYHAGFYDFGDEFESVAAQAEIRWQATPTTRFALGYDGDYSFSIAGGFARRDRGYANFQLLLGGAFLLGIEGSVANIDFGTQLDAAGNPLGAGGVSERSDIQIIGSLFAEYRFTNWLGVNGNLTYTGNFTDFRYLQLMGAALVPDPAEFQKFEAWLGVRAFY
ncbi:MAG: outer membrane beta-barrel protein [Myxococcota bacterium]